MGRVIVADHQPLFREGLCALIAQAFGRLGWALECDEVNSLPEFLQALDSEDGVLDAAILDLSLLQGHGMSGLIAIRSRLPSTSLIVVSPDANVETIQLCMTCGVAGFVPRTAERHEILVAVQKVLAGGTSFPASSGALAADLGYRPPERRKPFVEHDYETLSSRQLAVLNLVKDGKSNKQIAWELSISETTVKAHMTAILRKLGVNSRAQAIVLLQRQHSREPYTRPGIRPEMASLPVL